VQLLDLTVKLKGRTWHSWNWRIRLDDFLSSLPNLKALPLFVEGFEPGDQAIVMLVLESIASETLRELALSGFTTGSRNLEAMLRPFKNSPKTQHYRDIFGLDEHKKLLETLCNFIRQHKSQFP
jgi:hypothetical protein